MNESHKETILLVEDVAQITSTIKKDLIEIGYNVLTANSGNKASINSNIKNADLILIDIDLAKDLADTDTAENTFNNNVTPIVLLINPEETNVIEKTEKINSYGYVVKNSGKAILHAAVKTALKIFNENRSLRIGGTEYKSTLDNLLVGVVVHASDTSILFSNPEASRILGLNLFLSVAETSHTHQPPVWCSN